MIFLEQWKIDVWVGVLTRVMTLDLRSDSDHLPTTLPKRDPLADRIGGGPELPGGGLVDDGHRLGVLVVRPTKVAAPDQRNSERLEISGADRIDRGLNGLVRAFFYGIRAPPERGGSTLRQRCGLDAGQGLRIPKEMLHEEGASVRIVPLRFQLDGQCPYVCRIEARLQGEDVSGRTNG